MWSWVSVGVGESLGKDTVEVVLARVTFILSIATVRDDDGKDNSSTLSQSRTPQPPTNHMTHSAHR